MFAVQRISAIRSFYYDAQLVVDSLHVQREPSMQIKDSHVISRLNKKKTLHSLAMMKDICCRLDEFSYVLRANNKHDQRINNEGHPLTERCHLLYTIRFCCMHCGIFW